MTSDFIHGSRYLPNDEVQEIVFSFPPGAENWAAEKHGNFPADFSGRNKRPTLVQPEKILPIPSQLFCRGMKNADWKNRWSREHVALTMLALDA